MPAGGRGRRLSVTRRSDGLYYLVDQNGELAGRGFENQAEAERAARDSNEWAAQGEAQGDIRNSYEEEPLSPQEEAQQRRAEAEEYYNSGEYQRDRDAGRPPRYMRPDQEYEQALNDAQERRADPTGYYDEDAEARDRARREADSSTNPFRRGSGGGGGGGGGGAEEPQWVRDTAGIPLIGGPADAWREEQRQQQAEDYWMTLGDQAPTAEELMVEYENSAYVGPDGELMSGDAAAEQRYITAQDIALRQMQDIAAGNGLDAADRARLALGRAEMGRDTRAMREADQAALAARGMGGSGQSVASMMGAQQYGAGALSQSDYQMQIAAQQRALQAMQNAGQLSTTARGQSFGEDSYRRGAIDDFNRWNTEYRRDWTERNTDRRNQSRESKRDARQQHFDNLTTVAAGATDQYNQGAQGRRWDRQRNDEQAGRGLTTLGAAAEELAG